MRRNTRTVLLSGLLLVVMLTGQSRTALSSACPISPNEQHPDQEVVPGCELQVQAPVSYSAWETQGWAYYCTGDHPYYWGGDVGVWGNYNVDNGCFTSTQNVFDETSINKFDSTFTNWCLKDETVTVTLGCSSVIPPGYGPSCNSGNPPVTDPGCAQSDARNYCITTGRYPVCFETFDETCGNGTTYQCTIDLLITWCYQCQ